MNIYDCKIEKALHVISHHDITCSALVLLGCYSAEIALVGHSASQEPQSRQASASITYLPSPSLIASAGHIGTHEPHATHSSEITYAIIESSLLYNV